MGSSLDETVRISTVLGCCKGAMMCAALIGAMSTCASCQCPLQPCLPKSSHSEHSLSQVTAAEAGGIKTVLYTVWFAQPCASKP